MANLYKNVNLNTLNLTEIISETNHSFHKQAINRVKGDSLEEMVKELLRPELKKWLNDNLSNIVNQLVEKEIKRITLKNK